MAIIEIVSPRNKTSRHALRTFVDKAVELIRQGVNMLVIDLLPPGPRDPKGIHPAIGDEITDQPFEQPPGKPLTLAAYQFLPTKTAYVEPVAVGDALPEMPWFLHGEWYVKTPLEETYQMAALPEFDGPVVLEVRRGRLGLLPDAQPAKARKI